MLKILIEAFKASKGRMPNALEMLRLRFKAAQQAGKGEVIEFPPSAITDWTKPRPTIGKKADVTELDEPLVNELARTETLASPTRIKQGFSTQSKLNHWSQNQKQVSDFIGRKNREFNSLNRADQKEVLDMFEVQIKKHMPKERKAGGGIAGMLGERTGLFGGGPPGVHGRETGGGYSDRERHERRQNDDGPPGITTTPTHIPKDIKPVINVPDKDGSTGFLSNVKKANREKYLNLLKKYPLEEYAKAQRFDETIISEEEQKFLEPYGADIWRDMHRVRPDYFLERGPIPGVATGPYWQNPPEYHWLAGGGIAGMLGEPTYQDDNHRVPFAYGNGVADKEAENAMFAKRVRELMDDGYDMGEAVRQAMKEGYKQGGRVPLNEGLLVPSEKPSGKEADKILWNKKLNFLKELKGGVGRRGWLNMVSEHLNDGLRQGVISKEQFNRAIMPLFGEAGETQTRALEKDDSLSMNEIMNIYGKDREDYPAYLLAGGGRAGFKEGKGPKMSRRGFMKLAAGLATIPIIGKYFKWAKPLAKTAKVADLTSVPIGNAPGMPSWFKPLVNKVIKEGDDVTKKLATKEREIVHTKKLDEFDEVTVYQDLNNGNVRVEYHGSGNMGEAPIQLDYKAGEMLEGPIKKGQPSKTKSEFSAVESEPEIVNWDGDIEWTGENVVNKVDDLLTDTAKLETYATGKNPTIKKLLKSEQKQKYINNLHDDQMEQVNYIENKHGMSADDYIDEGARVGDFDPKGYRDLDTRGMNLPSKIKKASGGRVPLFGGGAAKKLWQEFVERLFIKSSNDIRRGEGLFKGLNEKQRIVQHDNLTKLSEKFRKTGEFDKGANQYFGIDAEKEFAKAEAKLSTADEITKGIADVMQDTSEAGLARSIEVDNLKLEFPGITDDMINNILADTNPQRIAEVKATMKEALKMLEKGKGSDEIINIFKKTPKTKHASGGLAGMLGE